jgi:hypothetical protein
MLRSVEARDLSFWIAYEAVEGPIGTGGVYAPEADEYDIPEETQHDRKERVESKLMHLFQHPELQQKGE